MDKQTKKEFDNLAVMIKKGFDATAQKVDVDKRFEAIDKRFDVLEQGHEDIKLRLSQVAYRFELQDLEKRVRRLELKVRLHR